MNKANSRPAMSSIDRQQQNLEEAQRILEMLEGESNPLWSKNLTRSVKAEISCERKVWRKNQTIRRH